MVRKTAYGLVAIFLLISTAGVTLSRHYCGTSLRGTSIMSTPDACCDSESCCHDEIEIFKISDDYSSVSVLNVEKPVQPLVNILSPAVLYSEVNSRGLESYSDIPTPPLILSFQSYTQIFIL